MARIGRVNYHVHAAEQQTFHIDAGGIVGNLISPELVETDIKLHDLRTTGSTSFLIDSVAFYHNPTAITRFSDIAALQPVYDDELTKLLKSRLAVREVIVFDHTLRIDDPKADRKPARNVHSDYSPEGAEKRLIDLLGPDTAAEWATGHFAFINVWRPVGDLVNSAPIGFVRPSTVKDADWIKLDLIYPDRRGHIMGLAANDDHEWIYQSLMTPEEIVYFNIYDNKGQPPVAHSAIDLVENKHVSSIRQSIESRTLVRY